MVEAIRRLKSGRRVIHTTHDPFYGVPTASGKVDVEVNTQPAAIVVDLTNNPTVSLAGSISSRVDPHQRCDGGSL